MIFITCSNFFSFLRYLGFCLDFCGHVEKRLDKKAKVNFRIYDIRDCITNIYIKYIAQYLKK